MPDYLPIHTVGLVFLAVWFVLLQVAARFEKTALGGPTPPEVAFMIPS